MGNSSQFVTNYLNTINEFIINPLTGTANYSATPNNMKLVHWPRPLLAVPNVTAHSSTASLPITVLLYNGPLLCGFNVPIKGLNIHNVHN